MNLAFQVSLFILQSDFLRAVKSGASGFTSPMKKYALWIFIALNIQLPW
jgi:hypothetical protein